MGWGSRGSSPFRWGVCLQPARLRPLPRAGLSSYSSLVVSWAPDTIGFLGPADFVLLISGFNYELHREHWAWSHGNQWVPRPCPCTEGPGRAETTGLQVRPAPWTLRVPLAQQGDMGHIAHDDSSPPAAHSGQRHPHFMCCTLCLAPASLVPILPVSLPGATSLRYGRGGQEKAQGKNQQQMLSRDPDTSRPAWRPVMLHVWGQGRGHSRRPRGPAVRVSAGPGLAGTEAHISSPYLPLTGWEKS